MEDLRFHQNKKKVNINKYLGVRIDSYVLISIKWTLKLHRDALLKHLKI